MADKHRADVVKQPHAWVAECTCGWMSADWRSRDSAAAEADEHERGDRPPWSLAEVVPWSPTASD